MLGNIPEEQLLIVKPSHTNGFSGASEYTNTTSSSSKQSVSAGGLRKRTFANKRPKPVAPPTEIRQRVLSARMLRFKNLENQITVYQQQIYELEQENRSLKTIIRRQEKALTKYDGANAELPQLLNAHLEENRIWHSKTRALQKSIKELTEKLKLKEHALLVITDQNKHFHQLNRDRHLDEREKLAERVRELEVRINERDNDLKLLARKHQLETKLLRSQVQQENQKYREMSQKLQKTSVELARWTMTELNGGRNTQTRHRHLRESQSAMMQSTSYSYQDHSSRYPQHMPDNSYHPTVPSDSNFSKSPQSQTLTDPNNTLYEIQGPDDDSEPDFYDKINKIENARKLKRSKGVKISESQDIPENIPDQSPRTENPSEISEEDQPGGQNSTYHALDEDADLIDKFEKLNRTDIEEKESILDAVCDSLIKKNTISDLSSSSPTPSTIKPAKNQRTVKTKRSPIDQKQKNKLLAALKEIDANNSL